MSNRRSTSSIKKAEYEGAVFETFLRAHPAFAAHVQEVKPGREDSHADIESKLDDGTEVAWQLARWLDEKQIKAAKMTEALESTILTGIGEQGSNVTTHIRHCTLSLKKEEKRLDKRDARQRCTLSVKNKISRFEKRDAVRIKTEILRLIRDVDARWEQHPSWQSPQGCRWTAFKEYPTLGKYLHSVHFEPRMVPWARRPWPADQPWIHFEAPGGAYDPEVAICALVKRIEDKAEHYGGFGDEDVRLIVFYNEAILYNTPFRDLALRTFGDVAAVAKETLSNIRVPFTKVYLLNALSPRPEAFEVFPTLQRCK